MQGFNMGRYVPPEHEGVFSFNQASGKRAQRLTSSGGQTVRFEMPFAIWCQTCSPHPTLIAQGVRFNAEKKRVGNYHSTAIWAFRMKHPACGGIIEIRTDPKNTAYVVTEGARKTDVGEGRETEGVELKVVTEEERERLRSDAFAALEVKVGDKEAAKKEEVRIEELRGRNQRDWEDPYKLNQRMRRKFRVGRKEREVQSVKDEGLRERMGLEFEIEGETEEDRKKAGEVEFGPEAGGVMEKVRTRGMFAGGKARGTGASSKDELQRALERNTRAVVDPFLAENDGAKPTLLPGVKRKRETAKSLTAGEQRSHETAKPKVALVNDNYHSD